MINRSFRSITILFALLISPVAFAQENDRSEIIKLTFQEAIEIGLRNNIDLKKQNNLLNAVEAQRLNSLAQYLPSIGINGGGSRTDGQQIDPVSGNGVNVTSDLFSAQIGANYTLFNGFTRINDARSSALNFKAQNSLIERTKQDVIATISNQYLQVLLDQELVRIAQENLETQNVVLRQIIAFVETGSRAQLDQYNQEAIVKNNEVLVLRAKNNLENDKASLLQILQLDPIANYEIINPNWDIEEIMALGYELESMYEIAMENRADIKQLELQTQSAKYGMKSATSGYLPTLTLFASYGSQYFLRHGDETAESFTSQFMDLNPSLRYGFNFSIPLFDRFQTNTQRANAKVIYNNTQLDLENINKAVLIDVQRAYLNFENAIANYRASQAQLEASKLSFDLERERYELNSSDLVQYSQANRQYMQAQVDITQSLYTLMFQEILLDYATGTLNFENIK